MLLTHTHPPPTSCLKSSEPSALSWASAAPCIPPQRKIALEHRQVALCGMEGSGLEISVEQRRATSPTPKLRFCPSLFFLFSLESLCAFIDSFLMNLGQQRCGEGRTNLRKSTCLSIFSVLSCLSVPNDSPAELKHPSSLLLLHQMCPP